VAEEHGAPVPTVPVVSPVLRPDLVDDDADALYDGAPCGYLSTTPDGTIVKVNQTLLDWMGYERHDLVGRRFAQMLTGGGRIYHETHFAPMLQMQGKVRAIALDLVRADGSRLPALVNSVLSRAPDGSPTVIRTAIFDATDRREYERELLRAKERAEASEAHARALARTLQDTLIPPAVPDVPGLDLAAAYRPAGRGDEVGGDFFDIFEIARGDWVVAVGDVCGKGVEAAVVTAAVRYAIRGAAVRLHEPGKILEALNEVLLHHETNRFCTVVLVRLRRTEEGWIATSSAGGHPLPLLVRAGEQARPVGRHGTLLGARPTTTAYDVDVELRSGDAILLYTDGVTEGRRGHEFYGEERLRDVVTEHAGSAGSLCEAILADVLRFQTGDPRDDIVVLAVGVP
jgi:phosphoserine phosphatase RsbU/P